MHYRKEIELHIERITQQAAFRAHATIIKDHEKNSKYFFALEKKNYNKKVMAKLRDGKQIISKPKEILEKQKQFYEELYTTNPEVKFTLTNNTNIRLTQEDRIALDQPIQLSEVAKAIQSLKRNKSPGYDGLTTEFYQFFGNKLDKVYYEAIKYAFSKKELHTSARRGIITLIPKKDKDSLWLKNWRPLTMLNVDYKIIAKAVATRLKLVLPYIISDNQAGFMENRQISQIIRTTIDISQYSTKARGYLLNLDFEKCFDRIEHKSIVGSLRYFGFGEEFVNMTETLLHGFLSRTINNGYLSDFIPISRSCRQGCPISPYYYLLCGEVMSIEIRNHEGIRGITINQLETIIAQFADDTQLFLDSKKSLENAIKILSSIEANTGLKINFEKLSIHTIGIMSEPKICSKPLTWDPGGLTVLGIEIKTAANEQYNKTLSKASSILENWYYRDLTLIGKVLVVNVLVASLFVYPMQSLVNPTKDFYNCFNKMIEKFIWGNKRPKLPLEILQTDYCFGGLKLVNLEMKNMSLKSPG